METVVQGMIALILTLGVSSCVARIPVNREAETPPMAAVDAPPDVFEESDA
jgi:hypothetical protein